LLIQNFLKHAKVEMSMEYIHASEERKLKMPSPLKLMGQQIVKNNPVSVQHKLLSNDPNTTAIVPFNPDEIPIEKVEAVPDISDDLFRNVPMDFDKRYPKGIRPNFHQTILEDLRPILVDFHRHAAIDDPRPARIASAWNNMLKYISESI
jgi:hypothetical protein